MEIAIHVPNHFYSKSRKLLYIKTCHINTPLGTKIKYIQKIYIHMYSIFNRI